MSWGSWILLLVYPVLAACRCCSSRRRRLVRLLPAIGPPARSASADDPRVRRALGFVVDGDRDRARASTPASCSRALGARPLWSSGLLGPLFLASGLSSSAAFAHWASPEPEERRQMAWLDNLFLAIELGLIGLFLIGLVTSSEAHAEAAGLLLGGPYTAVFWVGVVGLGIVVPARHPDARRHPPHHAHAGRPDPRPDRRTRPALRHRLRRPVQPLARLS